MFGIAGAGGGATFAIPRIAPGLGVPKPGFGNGGLGIPEMGIVVLLYT
jgi:hypothetical protein